MKPLANNPKRQLITLEAQGVPFGNIALIGDPTYPALGGCRIISEKYSQTTATLATQLAETMEKKIAVCGLPLRGGKSVIALDQASKKADYLTCFARALNELNGRYITAVDIGTSTTEMNLLHHLTPFITCHTQGGDPSFYTAQSVLIAMKRACQYRYGDPDLAARTFVIQGAGKVATELVKQLRAISIDIPITIADKQPGRAQKLAAHYQLKTTHCDLICSTPGEIFIAAADSYLIGAPHLARLSCDIFAEAANNPCTITPDHYLTTRQILYLPDYLINGGGVIHCAFQYGLIPTIEEKLALIATKTDRYLSQGYQQFSSQSVIADPYVPV